MTIGLALTRSLILRHRIGLSIVLTYAVLVAVAVLAVGAHGMSAMTAMLLFSGLVVGTFYLATIFLHAESDLATPGSTYPNHYFTLPVRTSQLVVWPVLAGVLCLGGLTLGISFAIQKAGFNLDPVGATLVAVAVLTSLQAVFWYPMGFAFSKLLLTLVVIATIMMVSLSKEFFGATEGHRIGIFVGIISCAVFATWRGVARARNGEIPSIKLGAEPVAKGRSKQLHFRSAAQAQTWYEWRQQGRVLPAISLILFLLFMLPLFFNDTLSPLVKDSDEIGSVVAAVPTFYMAYFPSMLWMMAIYGWAVGCGAKRTDIKRGERTFHLVFGTRPMRDEDLVWTKIKVAALSTLKAWGLVFLATVPLLFLKGGFWRDGDIIETGVPLYRVLAHYLDGPTVLKISLWIFGLMFLTWRNYVIGFWAELSGSLVWRYAQPFMAILIVIIGFNSIADRPTWSFFAFGGAVALKWGFAAWLSWKQIKSGLVRSRSVQWVIAGYLLAVIALGSAALYVTSPVRIEAESLEQQAAALWFTMFALFLAVYLVPLNRILGAVSALSANRHR